MKIILVGYGKMGQAIERLAVGRGHEIVARIDLNNTAELESVAGDVILEFSHPDAALNNITRSIRKGIPVISGTTGWLEHRSEIEALCNQVGGTFFYASNFSLGVNLFFGLNRWLAQLMNNYPQYEARIHEIHHTEKKDAPSGTAITLAEGILENSTHYTSWAASPQPGILPVSSERVGTVPGTHQVVYTSPVDTLEIKHTAHTRDSFALGAVLVAEWIPGKSGILGMKDFLPNLPL